MTAKSTRKECAAWVVGVSSSGDSLGHPSLESKPVNFDAPGDASTLPSVTLKNLRKASKVTQAQMAEKLGITQANVSRIESRSDMMLSTLSSYARAVDAEVEIMVRIRHDVFQLRLEESRGLKHGFKFVASMSQNS